MDIIVLTPKLRGRREQNWVVVCLFIKSAPILAPFPIPASKYKGKPPRRKKEIFLSPQPLPRTARLKDKLLTLTIGLVVSVEDLRSELG